MLKHICRIAILALAIHMPATHARGAQQWRTLEPGLELEFFALPQDPSSPDSALAILRMDPARFRLRLLNASATKNKKPLTARDWRRRYRQIATINASMFQLENPLRSVSLMKTRAHVNSARVSKDKTILAFDPLRTGIPAVRMIDRECQNFDSVRHLYGTLVQNIRMISCTGRNTWAGSSGKTPLAALGVDARGRVLFILGPGRHTVSAYAQALLLIPGLSIKNVMYLEGGGEAQLSIQTGRFELELGGKSGLYDASGQPIRPLLPNVIGIERN